MPETAGVFLCYLPGGINELKLSRPYSKNDLKDQLKMSFEHFGGVGGLDENKKGGDENKKGEGAN